MIQILRFTWIAVLLCSQLGLLFGQSYQELETQIPEGWNIIMSTEGDLNNDKVADLAILIENTLSEHIAYDEQREYSLNYNPRALMVFLKNKEGLYQLIGQNDTGFIPPSDDRDNPCIVDPLMENGELRIKNNVLHIALHFWLSCGSYEVASYRYKFQYNGMSLDLVAGEVEGYHRATGEASLREFDFVRKLKMETTGVNMFEGGEPVRVESEFEVENLKQLETLNNLNFIEILQQ